MTSTITPGNLTVTLTEAVTLSDTAGSGHGQTITNSFTVGSVSRITHRIETVPLGSETGVVSFAANVHTVVDGTPFSSGYFAGHIDEDDVRYLRITNKDGTNFVTLILRSGTKEYAVKLDTGRSFIFGVDEVTGVAGTVDASTTAITPTLTDLDDITATADAGDCQLEVYIASVG